MKKPELIDAIATQAGLTKTDAGKALDAMLDTITQSLKAGDDVALIGFGTFTATARAERTGRNPQTGAAIKIAASRQPAFKAGKTLKDVLNS